MLIQRIAMNNSNNSNNPNQVLLPIIRRIMPNLIANEIIGVQPMTGETGAIFTGNRANPKHCYE